MNQRFAPLPEPPYYAVIFTAQRVGDDLGYGEMSARMVELAAAQPGFLGVDATRDESGLGITVSYWADEAALQGWKAVAEHLLAQKLGKTRWYDYYTVRIAKGERAYSGPEGRM